MTQAEHEVLLRYPDAYHHYNTDIGKHKVYRREGETRVALSASWDTESMAWHEVWSNTREPVATRMVEVMPTEAWQPLHEGDDGR